MAEDTDAMSVSEVEYAGWFKEAVKAHPCLPDTVQPYGREIKALSEERIDDTTVRYELRCSECGDTRTVDIDGVNRLAPNDWYIEADADAPDRFDESVNGELHFGLKDA